jgi:hypothetical protein
MSGKHYAASAVAAAVIAAPLTFAVAACSSSGSSVASSLATTSAVAKAKNQVTTCVSKTGATALLSSSGRTDFINCMEALVPPAQRAAFKTCITSAVTGDKIWTSAGRETFINQSLPNCMNASA